MKALRIHWPSHLAIVLALTGLVTLLHAADKASSATGTWKWSVERNGQTFEPTLKLKQDGEKLTGVIIGRNNNETEIQEGKIKEGKVSFKVVRKFNNNEVTSNYLGTLDGDTIKGKVQSNVNGEDRSYDWDAKRVKDEK